MASERLSERRAEPATAPREAAGAESTPAESPDFAGRMLALQSRLGNRRFRGMLLHALPTERDGATTADRARPLEPAVRQSMQHRFGRDFGDVRVHTGPGAAASAHSHRARAYTTGPDVVFAPGEYAPQTREGRAVIAHELAHVVQQRGAGAADASGAAAGETSAGALERQAKSASSAALAGQDVGPLSPAPAGSVQALGENESPAATAPAPAADPDKDESLGPLDSWAADQTAGRVIGEPGWSFFREMLRGFKGGIRGAGAIVAGRADQMPGVRELPWIYLKYLWGLAKGLVSPITDLYQLVKFVVVLNWKFHQWLYAQASALTDSGALLARAERIGKSLGGLAEQFDKLVGDIAKNPKQAYTQIRDMMDSAMASAKGIARSLGRKAAGEVKEFLNLPWAEMAEKVGEVIGTLLVQVLMIIFTAEIGNAISAIGKAAGKVVTWVVEKAGALLRFLTGVFRKVMTGVGEMAAKAGKLFQGLLSKVMELFGEVGTFFEEAAAGIKAPLTAEGPQGAMMMSGPKGGPKMIGGRTSPATVADITGKGPPPPGSVAAGAAPPKGGLASTGGGGGGGGGSKFKSHFTGEEVAEEIEAAEKLGHRTELPGGTDKVSAGPNPRTSASVSPSELLGSELKKAGYAKPGPGFEANHIVPAGDPRAARLQNFLESRNIPLNSADNGVWLARGPQTRNVGAGMRHEMTFGNNYFEALEKALLADRQASREKVVAILASLRDAMLESRFP